MRYNIAIDDKIKVNFASEKEKTDYVDKEMLSTRLELDATRVGLTADRKIAKRQLEIARLRFARSQGYESRDGKNFWYQTKQTKELA